MSKDRAYLCDSSVSLHSLTSEAPLYSRQEVTYPYSASYLSYSGPDEREICDLVVDSGLTLPNRWWQICRAYLDCKAAAVHVMGKPMQPLVIDRVLTLLGKFAYDHIFKGKKTRQADVRKKFKAYTKVAFSEYTMGLMDTNSSRDDHVAFRNKIVENFLAALWLCHRFPQKMVSKYHVPDEVKKCLKNLPQTQDVCILLAGLLGAMHPEKCKVFMHKLVKRAREMKIDHKEAHITMILVRCCFEADQMVEVDLTEAAILAGTRMHFLRHGLHSIGVAVQTHRFLHKLDLSGLGLNDLSLEFFLRPIESPVALNSLVLAANQISGAGFARLCGTLGMMPNLTELNMSTNGIGKGGLSAIGPHLDRLQLKTLNLANNFILNDDVLVLSRKLPCCKTLQVLDLSGNWLTDIGAGHLCEALVHNHQLASLNVESNGVTEPKLRELADNLGMTRPIDKPGLLERSLPQLTLETVPQEQERRRHPRGRLSIFSIPMRFRDWRKRRSGSDVTSLESGSQMSVPISTQSVSRITLEPSIPELAPTTAEVARSPREIRGEKARLAGNAHLMGRAQAHTMPTPVKLSVTHFDQDKVNL
ncbi:NLRC3 [Branchiostoma lanceolatum]|uniref:NLRC3 protein n=1 Tax=Branchiostoma lanceolatum TaxID=7740 RepID=A0A8J9ZDR9_BRALA|nr:NLRC3 [Branchiostoma lanceolatum]